MEGVDQDDEKGCLESFFSSLIVTVMAAGVVFDEVYSTLRWAGGLLLSGAILGPAAFNLAGALIDRRLLWGLWAGWL